MAVGPNKPRNISAKAKVLLETKKIIRVEQFLYKRIEKNCHMEQKNSHVGRTLQTY